MTVSFHPSLVSRAIHFGTLNWWNEISGDIYEGKWNGWYGPSGRGKEFAYNFTQVEDSMVARAFKNNNITFPTKQTINELRKNASVSCRPCNNQPCKYYLLSYFTILYIGLRRYVTSQLCQFQFANTQEVSILMRKSTK